MQDNTDLLLTGLHLMRSTSCNLNYRFQKFILYFEYCNESVVPPLLENWQRFNLPRDLDRFMSILKDADLKGSINSVKRKQERQCVKHLQDAIAECSKYMEENPAWFLCHLESQLTGQVEGVSLSEDVDCRQPPLDVVTVEQDGGSRTQSATSIPVLTRLPMEKVSSTRKLNHNSMPSLDSWSSSIEDLEHDVSFILHPRLPNEDSIVSVRDGWIDVLPNISMEGISYRPKSPSSISSSRTCSICMEDATSEL